MNLSVFDHQNFVGRCISAVIGGSEFVRLEREHQQRRFLSNGHVGDGDTLDPDIQSRLSAETNIKSSMQIYVKFSAGIVLDSWSETNRYICIFYCPMPDC